jgi:large subunit ribosomal protein L7e
LRSFTQIRRAETKVPESVLKKRKSVEKLTADRAERLKTLRKKRATQRKVIFKRAEKYVKEYRNQEKQLVFYKRQAKAAGNYYREPEAKLAFVIRIRGVPGIHPKPRKILQLLRLRQLNTGVFVRLTKATQAMLRRVEPFVTYGNPNLKSVKELLYKRGYAKVNKQRLPITDNTVIEQNLGRKGLVCLEDVVHEVVTVGKHFREVNKFLWPFKLPNPRGGWRTKNIHFAEGGDAGNRGDLINELIHRMV